MHKMYELATLDNDRTGRVVFATKNFQKFKETLLGYEKENADFRYWCIHTD